MSTKPFIGKVDKVSYAINLDLPNGNKFPTLPFARQIEDMRVVREFKTQAKRAFISAKRIPTLKAVRQWVKDFKPASYYARWQADCQCYKDDVVELFYLPSE